MCSPDLRGLPRPRAAAGSPSPKGPRLVAVPVPYVASTCEDLAELDESTDEGRGPECARNHLCQVCGLSFADEVAYAIPRPGYVDLRIGISGHGLMHRSCTRLALQHCPSLLLSAKSGSLTVLSTKDADTYALLPLEQGRFRDEIDTASARWEIVVQPSSPQSRRRCEQQLQAAGLA